MSHAGGDVAVADPSVMSCLRCRRVFSIDCSVTWVSPSVLAGEAPTRAEALRRRAKERQSDVRRSHPVPVSIPCFGPTRDFCAVRSFPWLQGRAETTDLEAPSASLSHASSASAPLCVAPPLQWSSSIAGAGDPRQVLVRIDRESLLAAIAADGEQTKAPSVKENHVVVLQAQADAGSVKQDAIVDTPLPPQEVSSSCERGSYVARPLRSVLKAPEESPAAVRPRGGQLLSTTSADPTQSGAYVHKSLLLHSCWDLLHTVGEEGRLDVPQCPSCWRQSIAEMQTLADAREADVNAAGALTRDVSRERLVMCHRQLPTHSGSVSRNSKPSSEELRVWCPGTSVPGTSSLDTHAAESDALLLRSAWDAIQELDDLECEMERLRCELHEAGAAERRLEDEEAEVVAHTNALRVQQAYAVDIKEMQMIERSALEHELEFHKERCFLRELFVIEMPAQSAMFGVINGLRLGKIGDFASSHPAAPAATAAPLLVYDFCGGVSYAARTAPPLLLGDVYFPYTITGPITLQEVNCACGYMAAALRTVAQRNQLTLTSCVLRPNGPESVIDVPVPAGKRRSLGKTAAYNTCDFFIVERFFAWKTFGQACVAYCLGLKEAISFLQQALNGLQGDLDVRGQQSIFAPFPIDADGQVGGFSVRHGSAADDVWARGMRCALANLDWCLTAQTVLEALQRERVTRGPSKVA